MEAPSRCARLLHVLDYGGLWRARLRGCEKLTNRHMAGTISYNLSLFLRKLFRVETPKQAQARADRA